MDKDTLKNELTIDQIFNLLSELGGQPIQKGECIVSKTICHNKIDEIDEASYKLYYYNNTHLFHCYTGCDEPSFDIFELVIKVKKNAGINWSLSKSVNYVAKFFGYSVEENDLDFEEMSFKDLPDWEILKKYDNIGTPEKEQEIKLKVYDKKILKYLPKPRIKVWEDEGISKEVIKQCNICYDPVNQGIVIPHYDIDGKLIGIRERTLIKEEEANGKYRPAWLNGTLYNHPLGFNLYNLNHSKDNIRILKKAVVFEAEKSTMLYRTFFDNDISVACCGSNLIYYQVKLLLSLGAEEIIIAFDRQFKKVGDEEFKRWTKKLTSINDKYKNFCQISFVFDRRGLLGYKDSPIDKGKDIFMKLLKERIML